MVRATPLTFTSMISRQAKALFYLSVGPIMRFNGLLYRLFRAPATRNRERVLVQLGPGQRCYLEGWINVDANMFTARCDVWSDISGKLPFKDESVDAVYSHHVIEHLPDLHAHFQQLFRVLKPGGVFRVGGPNGDAAMREYLAGNKAWFSDFPDNRSSIGGRFENLIFCRREHLTILTPSYLEEIASGLGFEDLRFIAPITETGFPEIFDSKVMAHEWESTPESPHTLLMEGRKPSSVKAGEVELDPWTR
ncbi:MAG TPA: methyltransferase domain-containing protein [Prosthecobacter sp.]